MCRGAGGVGGRGEAGGAGGFLPFPRAPSRLSEAQAPKRSEGSQKAPQTASARRGGGRRVVFELPALVGIGARRMKEQPRNSKSTGTGSKPRGNGARPSPRGLCIPNLETPPRGPAVAGTIGCSRRSGHGLPGPVSVFKSLREFRPSRAPPCRGRPVTALPFPVWDDAVVAAGRSLLVGSAAGPRAASAGIGPPVPRGRAPATPCGFCKATSCGRFCGCWLRIPIAAAPSSPDRAACAAAGSAWADCSLHSPPMS